MPVVNLLDFQKKRKNKPYNLKTLRRINVIHFPFFLVCFVFLFFWEGRGGGGGFLIFTNFKLIKLDRYNVNFIITQKQLMIHLISPSSDTLQIEGN